MHSPGINAEGKPMGQLANPGSPGKMAVETECVCALSWNIAFQIVLFTVHVLGERHY